MPFFAKKKRTFFFSCKPNPVSNNPFDCCYKKDLTQFLNKKKSRCSCKKLLLLYIIIWLSQMFKHSNERQFIPKKHGWVGCTMFLRWGLAPTMSNRPIKKKCVLTVYHKAPNLRIFLLKLPPDDCAPTATDVCSPPTHMQDARMTWIGRITLVFPFSFPCLRCLFLVPSISVLCSACHTLLYSPPNDSCFT